MRGSAPRRPMQHWIARTFSAAFFWCAPAVCIPNSCMLRAKSDYGGAGAHLSGEGAGHMPGLPYLDGGRQRDLFPLPVPAEERYHPGKALSRGTAQRVRRRVGLRSKTVEVVKVLNEVFGAEREGPALEATRASPPPKVTAAQHAAVEHLSARIAAVKPPSTTCTPHAAARELLSTRLGYAEPEARTRVVPYCRELVSRPQAGSTAPMIGDLLDPAAAEMVRDFRYHLLLSPDEWEQTVAASEPIVPYMDEILKNDSQQYHTFICDLYRADIIDFTADPSDLCTPFFVSKTWKRTIRLVFDARIPNRRFKNPPPDEAGFWSYLGSCTSVSGSRLLYSTVGY